MRAEAELRRGRGTEVRLVGGWHRGQVGGRRETDVRRERSGGLDAELRLRA